MKVKDSLAVRIGNKIKETRKQAGLTLKQLADATKLTPGTLSKIENGLTKPSITTLEMLADTLKIDIGYLFKVDEGRRYLISRRENRRSTFSERGYSVEFLTEGMENQFMEPAIVTLRGRDQKEEMRTVVHTGQEFVYVLEGRIRLSLSEKSFILKKGDAAYFDGDLPHKGTSLTKRPARTLNVHLIPGRRVGTFETQD